MEDTTIYSQDILMGIEKKDFDPIAAQRKLKKDKFFDNCRAASRLELKRGAQVILLRNIDLQSENKLVNGSRGFVVGFESWKEVCVI